MNKAIKEQTSTICVQICSNMEWQSVLDIQYPDPSAVCSYPQGRYFIQQLYGAHLVFFHSGIGKTRAGAACQYAIDHWRPGIILVMGTCGGVAEEIKLLDIIVANRTGQYDCIERMGEVKNLFYEPFTTDIDNSWIGLESIANAREGLVATADQDLNHEMLEVLRSEKVLCADWESGAIAYICKLNQVPCCVVRGISDKPGTDSNAEVQQGLDYRHNTPIIMKKMLAEVLPELIRSHVARSAT